MIVAPQERVGASPIHRGQNFTGRFCVLFCLIFVAAGRYRSALTLPEEAMTLSILYDTAERTALAGGI